MIATTTTICRVESRRIELNSSRKQTTVAVCQAAISDARKNPECAVRIASSWYI